MQPLCGNNAKGKVHAAFNMNLLIYSSLFKTLVRKSDDVPHDNLGEYLSCSKMEGATHMCHPPKHYSQICNERERVRRCPHLKEEKIRWEIHSMGGCDTVLSERKTAHP